MDMVRITKCDMADCAYNKGDMCRTPGITVGPHAECHTYVHASSRGGIPEVEGAIGACLASSCAFNKRLECTAPAVDVAVDDKHADCETFQAKK